MVGSWRGYGVERGQRRDWRIVEGDDGFGLVSTISPSRAVLTHTSYPVNPEVGKIGTNSPTYIQPVSERSDGIKSFFQKQQPSPAKPKAVKSEKVKAEELVLSAEKVKEEAEGIKAEIGEGDEEKGLGDDSNAPNPEVKDEPVVNEDDAKLSGVSPSKRKRPLPEEEQEERNGKGQEKRGGRQTKVIRKASGDDNKEVGWSKPRATLC